MDAKKIPEVEMKELTTAEVQHKDAKKGKMEETKGKKKFLLLFIFIFFKFKKS